MVVFAQLAGAAFACAGLPGLGATAPTAAKAVAMGRHDGAVPGSTGRMSLTAQILCLAHCQYGQQGTDSSARIKAPDALLTTLYTLRPPADADARLGSLDASRRPRAAADPPHTILHCCLRD